VIQGGRLLSDLELLRRSEEVLRIYGEEDAWPLGPYRLPHKFLYNHVLFLGAPGSGKTTFINQLKRNTLAKVRPGSGHRACIWDYRSEELQHLAALGLWRVEIDPQTGERREGPTNDPCPVSYINPADTRGIGIDLAKDITNELEADQFARDMIAPKSNEESEEAVWIEAARNCLSQVVQVFQETSGANWRLIDVVEACFYYENLQQFLNLTREGRATLKETFGAQGQAKGVMFTIQSFAKKLRPIAASMARKPSVSLTDWVRKEEGIIVIGNNPVLKENLAPFQRWMFGHLVRSILLQGLSETKRYLFFLDEIRQAPFGGYLGELATNGRAKGACMIGGLQDYAGLKDALTEKKAEELLGMFDTLAFLRLTSPETAEWVSKFFGKHLRLVSEKSEGLGSNRGESEQHQHGTSSGPGGTSTSRSVSRGTSTGSSYQQNIAYRETERTLVYPNEFREIKKPRRDGQDGLVVECFVSIPDVGQGRVVTGRMEERTIIPVKEVATESPVGNRDLKYRWEAQDLVRLKLPQEMHATLLADDARKLGEGAGSRVEGDELEVDILDLLKQAAPSAAGGRAEGESGSSEFREVGPLIYRRGKVIE
jgi:Type IV secretion-system coupling protein DNA-binding domain